MASKSEREIAADNGMWLTHPSHLTVKKKVQCLSAKQEKIQQNGGTGSCCLNRETPGKSWRLGR